MTFAINNLTEHLVSQIWGLANGGQGDSKVLAALAE